MVQFQSQRFLIWCLVLRVIAGILVFGGFVLGIVAAVLDWSEIVSLISVILSMAGYCMLAASVYLTPPECADGDE